MALLIKLLGAGVTNAGTNTDLYPVPASTSAIVSNVRLVNTTAGTVTVNLFYRPNGGSQVRILDKDYQLAVNDLVVVSPDLTMGASDKIEVTTSAAIDFVVSGMQRT